MLAALLLLAGWSAAEAAIFFIVADVGISWIAVTRGTRAAMLAAVVAAIASILGGAVVYLWADYDAAAVATVYAGLPGIGPDLIAEAADRYRKGPHAVLAGAFGGIPFKLFALEAAKAHDYSLLMLAPLLRLPRYLLVAVSSGLIATLLTRWISTGRQLALLVASWIAFYVWYWSAMAA